MKRVSSQLQAAPGAKEPTSSRLRILNAAKQLFARQGYDNTSTLAIARLAESSESQLMKHFGSKEGLLEAIFEAGWENMEFTFRAIHELESPGEKFEVLLEMVQASLSRDPELKDLILLEGRHVRKDGHMIILSKGFLRFVGVVDAILLEMRACGELRNDVPVDGVRTALISSFEGLLRDCVLAARMGFPAAYDNAGVLQIVRLVLSAFLTGPNAAAANNAAR